LQSAVGDSSADFEDAVCSFVIHPQRVANYLQGAFLASKVDPKFALVFFLL
jgi:hypothetical protein